jgi:hypothetical protein
MKGFSSWLRVMGVGLALVATLLAQPPQDKTGRSQGPEFVPLRQPYFVPAAQANFLASSGKSVGNWRAQR